MNKSFTTLLLLSLLFLLPAIVAGQSFTVKEATETIDSDSELFNPTPGIYVSISRIRIKNKATAYDSKMRELYTQPIEELGKNRYLGAIEANKRLHIFSADKKDISILQFDAAKGKAEGTLTPVLTTDNSPQEFYKGFTPDSSYCFAAFECPHPRKSYQQFDGVIMNNKMNVVTKFSFQLENIKHNIDNTSFILSPGGVLYVITKIKVKTKKDDFRPFQYIITEINKEGKTVTSFLDNLPTGRLSNMVWTSSKSGLNFTGLLSKSEKEAFQYLVSGEFNSGSKKVTNLKESALGSSPFWAQASGEILLAMKTRGISANAELVKHFILADSSILMVVQPLETDSYTYGSGAGGSMRTRTTIHSGTAYILKIKKELEWMQVIPLSQHENLYQAYCGVLPILQNGKDLYVFCHDYVQNTGDQPEQKIKEMGLGTSWPSIQLTAFRISDKGAINRIRLANYTPGGFRLNLYRPMVNTEGEGVFTLSQDRVMNSSSYKLALFAIK